MKRDILLLAVAAMGVTVTARADVVERRHDETHDYYTFDDELVSSDVFDSTTPLLTVRKTVRGARLLRPRVSFVTEILKSSEKF